MRYLTFALAKGRLANKTMDMFEKLGITCDSIRDKAVTSRTSNPAF